MRTWIPTGATTVLLTAGLVITGAGVAYAETTPVAADPMPASDAGTAGAPVAMNPGSPAFVPSRADTGGSPGNRPLGNGSAAPGGQPASADQAGRYPGHPQRQIAARRPGVLTPVREQRRVEPVGRNDRADPAGRIDPIGRTGPMSGVARLLPQGGPSGMARH